MFVFMSSGDFIYRSGTTYGWSRAEGHGTYVINEKKKEIKLTGMQVASLIKGTDLRNDSVSGSEIHFYKFDDNSGVYESGMWAKYIIINKDIRRRRRCASRWSGICRETRSATS